MKERASMNRTITLSPEDISIVAPKIDHVFIEDKNQIINEDFEKINKTIPDKYFDLIIIDPPYNLTKQYLLFFIIKQKYGIDIIYFILIFYKIYFN